MTSSVLDKSKTLPAEDFKPNQKSDDSLPALTGLRFVAAFVVLLAHLLPKTVPLANPPMWYTQIIASGTVAMTIFFVLSGFVIHYNYSGKIESDKKHGVYNFFVARAARIYPLFLAVFAYQLFFSFCYAQTPDKTLEIAPFHLFFMQSWFYSTAGKFGLIYSLGILLQATWSVSTEFFFYLCYPGIRKILSCINQLKVKLGLLIIITIMAFSAILTASAFESQLNDFGIKHFGAISEPSVQIIYSFYRWIVYFSPYARILEFLTGCLCASIFMQLRPVKTTIREERWGLAALCLALPAIFALNGFYTWANNLTGPIHTIGCLQYSCGLAPLAAIIIFCCVRYKNFVTRILCSWPFLLCGEATYSLYLLHVFVGENVRWESAPAVNFWIGVGDCMRLVMAILMSIGFSLVTWRIIEVPARRWVRKTFSIRPPASTEA